MPTYKVLTMNVHAKQVRIADDPWGGPIYEWVYDTASFEAKVQAAIASGATPIGGVSISGVGKGLGQSLIYTQAVLFP